MERRYPDTGKEEYIAGYYAYLADGMTDDSQGLMEAGAAELGGSPYNDGVLDAVADLRYMLAPGKYREARMAAMLLECDPAHSGA